MLDSKPVACELDEGVLRTRSWSRDDLESPVVGIVWSRVKSCRRVNTGRAQPSNAVLSASLTLVPAGARAYIDMARCRFLGPVLYKMIHSIHR